MGVSRRSAVVGGVLRALRQKAERSQADVARRLGVAEITVRQWESGKRVPSLLELAKLARALGVKSSRLGSLLGMALQVAEDSEKAGATPAPAPKKAVDP